MERERGVGGDSTAIFGEKINKEGHLPRGEQGDGVEARDCYRSISSRHAARNRLKTL